ncbi:MAG: IS630 family transposase [Pseudomonadota bacterium]
MVADRNTAQKHVWRAQIVLLTAEGLGTHATMAATGTSKTTVWRWQERFAEAGVEGLLSDKTRPPGKAPISSDKTAEVVRLTQAQPPHEATHWTARAMAKAVGLGVATVQRIWAAHGLAPHRWRVFKFSKDPAFVEKLHDVVGLYVAPPAHAVVLSVDESEPRSAPSVRAPWRTQIQALDRTQPGLPLKKGRGATMTHDYKRHGTTTLIAALNVLTGEVFGRNMQRHRHQEFIWFLNALEKDIPAGKVVHVILDKSAVEAAIGPRPLADAAHKHAKVRAWLDRHPRWTFHFTPTSSSWLNAVEGFFAKLTRRRLKHGVFHSVVDLQAAINRFIAEHNATEAKPFVWRADPDAIIAS